MDHSTVRQTFELGIILIANHIIITPGKRNQSLIIVLFGILQPGLT
jgi:hypothetical protein